ncbi:MAG: triose-phosphate isomerase [Eubacteriales bacterium]
MNKQLRRPCIAGNWKMNKTPSAAKALIADLIPMVKNADKCDIVLCVPFVDLAAAVEVTRGTNIHIGAQNVHFAPSGAYTGEISADMLKEVGAEYVIIGHSERRQYFGETNETVNMRTKTALDAGLKVILCVGELLSQRDNGITNEIVAMQTKIALLGVGAEKMSDIIIAYEPVWAIGTGRTATAEQAEEVCGVIRGVISSLYGSDIAGASVVQYGGSMNASNASSLLAKEDIDGGLIGGASLKAPDFTVIVNSANEG